MNPHPAPTSDTQLCAVGVDVGGTKIAAGTVAFPGGAILARRLEPTLPKRGGAAILDDVERLVSELADEARAAGWRPEAIGIGVCEIVGAAGDILSTGC